MRGCLPLLMLIHRSFFGLRRRRHHLPDRCHFCRREFPPMTWSELAQDYVHDAGAFESYHVVPQEFAHAADLPVEALGKDNLKGSLVHLVHPAFFRDRAQDGHPFPHPFQKIRRKRPADRYDVFLFVVVSCPEDFIDHVSVVGEKDQPL